MRVSSWGAEIKRRARTLCKRRGHGQHGRGERQGIAGRKNDTGHARLDVHAAWGACAARIAAATCRIVMLTVVVMFGGAQRWRQWRWRERRRRHWVYGRTLRYCEWRKLVHVWLFFFVYVLFILIQLTNWLVDELIKLF